MKKKKKRCPRAAWRGPSDLCLSVVLLFYCNWYTVITSHLVNCLLPQKCFKFKFYITVLMFYKWYTSCLCIICSILVIKAQSLNFILKSFLIWISVWRKSAFWSLVNHFIGSLQAEKKDCWLWLCIQLRTFELLSFRFELSVVCTERIACRFTCRRFYWTSWLLCPPVGMMKSLVMDWFHLLFLSAEFISSTPVSPWPLAITSGVGLDNALNLSNCWLWISYRLVNLLILQFSIKVT